MINYTNPRPSGQRHPLRSVNEHAALLRSPGPLESMLKTTTETGDIGIFSIRPNPSSTFGRPTRSRSHPREASLPFPARPSGYDENYYRHPNDRRRMRSYRDTASEIISLYGSESQQTLMSSVSPASLEDDPRSYSMTTTPSSKRIPSQKSTENCSWINNVSAVKITDFALFPLASSLRCQSGWLFYVMGNSQAIESAPPGFCGPEHSEQFEDEPPWDGEMDLPLHPIPKRAENIRQSLLLMDDIEGNFDLGGNYSDSTKSDAQAAEEPSAEPCHSPDAVDCNTEDTEARQLTPADDLHAREYNSPVHSGPSDVPISTISDEEESQPRRMLNDASPDTEADAVDMLSLMSDSTSLRSNSPLETPPKVTETKFDVVSESQSRQPSQAGFSKARYSLDPSLSGFASIVTSFDHLERVTGPKDSEVQFLSGERHDAFVYSQGEPHPGVLNSSSRRPSPTPPRRIEEQGGVYQKRHRRNGAASRISITGIVPDSYMKRTPERRNSLRILSPAPISPARQLRVKESIPQLMKALPPLPREAEKLSGYGTADYAAEIQSESPCNTIIPTRHFWCRGVFGFFAKANVYQHSGILRLSIAIKAAAQSNTEPELTPCIKRDAFDDKAEIDKGNKGRGSSFDSSSCNSVAVEVKPIRFEPSPQPSDQFNIPYPPSPAKAEVHPSAIPPVSGGALLIETGDSCAGHRPSESHGLRGKLSMLRLRFASTQKYEGTILPVTTTVPTPGAMATQSINEWYNAGINRNPDQPAAEQEKVEWRVKRWARAARKAVRLYVKKTMERSPRASA
ncbi:hypothetical protein MKX07_006367 [Trichoderma sp. CBMAI-0711]|nr:hypothetical protein MKX07_006367 [Trichoderma sp. CBMAI-0711]